MKTDSFNGDVADEPIYTLAKRTLPSNTIHKKFK